MQSTGYSLVEQLLTCANLFPISSAYAIVATTWRMSNTMRASTKSICLCVCECVCVLARQSQLNALNCSKRVEAIKSVRT